MRRKLFTATSVLSLLLCVATVVLWVESYQNHDYITWDYDAKSAGGPYDYATISCAGGEIMVTYYRESGRYYGWDHVPASGLRCSRAEGFQSQDELSRFGWHRLAGFTFKCEVLRDPGGSSCTFGLGVPPWFLMLLVVPLPLLPSLHRRWKRRRDDSRKARCPTCRYDLTGNTSGVCPECGTAVAGKAGI